MPMIDFQIGETDLRGLFGHGNVPPAVSFKPSTPRYRTSEQYRHMIRATNPQPGKPVRITTVKNKSRKSK